MSGWHPILLEDGAPLLFPDPQHADPDGLVAVGGDLSVDRLLFAYQHGIFPWSEPGEPPFWWSPDPRCVLEPDRLHVSKSLQRTLRRGGFRLSWNEAFCDVMRACGERAEGSWIFAEMLRAYAGLHDRGFAHSLEVWIGADLVGGIYGVQIGGLFAAESKFHRRPDMSKVALVACVRSVFAAGIELFDAQFQTPHLESMGAWEWPRRQYLARLRTVTTKKVDLGGLQPSWCDLTGTV